MAAHGTVSGPETPRTRRRPPLTIVTIVHTCAHLWWNSLPGLGVSSNSPYNALQEDKGCPLNDLSWGASELSDAQVAVLDLGGASTQRLGGTRRYWIVGTGGVS